LSDSFRKPFFLLFVCQRGQESPVLRFRLHPARKYKVICQMKEANKIITNQPLQLVRNFPIEKSQRCKGHILFKSPKLNLNRGSVSGVLDSLSSTSTCHGWPRLSPHESPGLPVGHAINIINTASPKDNAGIFAIQTALYRSFSISFRHFLQFGQLRDS